jgi:hypothetical protein
MAKRNQLSQSITIVLSGRSTPIVAIHSKAPGQQALAFEAAVISDYDTQSAVEREFASERALGTGGQPA